MARKIGAVIALDGEQQFKQAVSACTRSLNTMKSELKYVEAQAGTQGKTLESLKGKHEVLNKVLDASKQKEEAIGKGLEHAKTDYENTGKQLDSYKDQLKLAQEKLDKMKSSADTTDEELKEQQEVVKGLTEIVGQGEKEYEKAGIRVDDWQKKLYDAKTETAKAEQAVDENKKAMEELETATDKAGGEIKEFGDEAHNAADKTGELDISLSSMVKNAAVNLAVDAMKSIGSKAGEAAKYVLDVGTQFEASMSKVSAVSGATGSDIAALSQKAQEMGSTTKFSASEAAEAMNYMAMAGWKTQDMLGGIEGIMNLAAASGEDLATTSDIVTDALTAFGLKAQDSGHFADVLAAASSNANTNVSMLGESFKYAAPVAGALGSSAEDTTLALGLMANAGIKASQAGTALRTGLTNLANPTKNMQIAMNKYGIALAENKDGSVNLRETMISLREKMGGVSEAEQAAGAAAIFGKNAMSGWLAVINASDEDFDKLVTSIDNCDGTSLRMAKTMQNNLTGAVTIFKSATEGLGIAIYEKVAKPLTGVVEFATGVISGLTGAIKSEKTVMQEFLDDIKDTNDAVRESIQNARDTVTNAESKVAELDTYKQSFSDILTKCDEFNHVTLETGETAIVDASGNIVQALGGIGDEAGEEEEILGKFAEDGVNTEDIKTSTETAEGYIDGVGTKADDTEGKLDKFAENGVSTKGIESSTGEASDMIGKVGEKADSTEKGFSDWAKDGLSTSGIDDSTKDASEMIDGVSTTADDVDRELDGWASDGLNTRDIEDSTNTAKSAIASVGTQADETERDLDGWAPDGLDTTNIEESAKTAKGSISDISTEAGNVEGNLSGFSPDGLNTKGIETSADTAAGDIEDIQKTASSVDGELDKFGENGLKNASEISGDAEDASGDIKAISEAADSVEGDLNSFAENGINTSGIKTTTDEAVGMLGYVESEADTVETRLSQFAKNGIDTSKIEEGTSAIIQYFTNGKDGVKEVVETTETAISKSGKVEIDTENVEAGTGVMITCFDKATGKVQTFQTTVEELGDGKVDLSGISGQFDKVEDSVRRTYVITDEFTKAKINTMIQTMGDSVGDLADAWDEQTGKLHASKEELDKWFDTAKDVAMYTALQDALTDVNKAYGEAAVNVAMAESGYKAAKKELDDFVASSGKSVEELEREANSYNMLGQCTSETGAKYRELSNAVVAAQEQVDETNKTLDTATQVLDDTNAALEPLKESYENATKAAEGAEEPTKDYTKALDGLGEESEDAKEATEKVIDALKDEQKAARELEEVMKTARDGITDAFDDMKESAESSFSVDPFGEWKQNTEDGMLKFEEAMKAQIEGLTRYRDNLTTIKDHVGKTSPEFVKYLEEMGQGGAQLVAELADSFNSGDASAAERLMSEYQQALDIQDEISTTLAADDLALKLGLGELGSTVEEWEDLGHAFDECVAQVQAGGDQVTEKVANSFWGAVDKAKEMGVQIPEGLADSIRDSDDPTTAIQEATTALNSAMQGQAQGLLEVAKQTGVNIPDGVEEAITSGVGDVAAAYSQLANALSGKDVEFEDAGKQSGQKMSTGTASGITEKQGDVMKSTEQVVDAAKTAATTATTTFKLVGSSAMEALKMGMSEQSQSVSAKVKAIITIVKNNAATHGDPLFETAGAGMISKYIEGMNSKSSDAAGKAKSIVENAQKAAKSQGDGTFKTAGSSAITNYVSGMTTKAKDVESKAKSIVNAAKSAAETAGKALQSVGQAAISNYISGMNSKSGDASAKAKSIGTASKDAIDGIRNAFTTAGSNAIENYRNGMNSKEGEVSRKAQEIADNVLNNLNKSSDAYNRGHGLATEYGNGIFWGSGTAYTNATNMANNAVNNTKRDSDAWWSGYNMAMGFADGIKGGIPWVEATARNMAAAARDAANKELAVASPSKVFRKIGNFTAEGFALGIKDGRSDVEDAVSETFDLGSTAVDALGGLDIAGGTVSLDATTHGANDRLDALIAIVNAYMPQILEANQSGKVFDLSGNFMGSLALQTSERIGQNVRRSR